MIRRISNEKTLSFLSQKIVLPKNNSHKGQNGKILIIGGSSLFHASSIWAAEISSYFVDMVHYSSTAENNKIISSLKKKFVNGIIISQKNLLEYVEEDEIILIGPGMIRGKIKDNKKINNYQEIVQIKNEAAYTYYLTRYLINSFPRKQFIFDAGALQMIDKDWFLSLKKKAIITPHQKEFERVFGVKIFSKSLKEKTQLVKKMAKKYNLFILLKAVIDIVSDGKNIYLVEGGNQGLTKGGTGDVLAGLVASLRVKNEPLVAMILASYVLKKTSDTLFPSFGYWYNMDKLIETIPQVFSKIVLDL